VAAPTNLKGNAMTTSHRNSTRIRAVLLLALLLAAGAAAAQAPAAAGAGALKRTEVLRGDVSDPAREAVVVKVELAAHAQAPRHTHPGDEISYVADGECDVLVDGEAPRHVKAGEAFIIKAGKVHTARNTSAAPVHLVGVYVVEKGKPLATPAK
jgi:quercetin dioxygenase-like cupin family protein